jgi:hypothetical protein
MTGLRRAAVLIAFLCCAGARLADATDGGSYGAVKVVEPEHQAIGFVIFFSGRHGLTAASATSTGRSRKTFSAWESRRWMGQLALGGRHFAGDYDTLTRNIMACFKRRVARASSAAQRSELVDDPQNDIDFHQR